MPKKKPPRKWEYRVTAPMLQPNATSPVMDHRQMEGWLNDSDAAGWEFVSYGQTRWASGTVQEWWIFRRDWSPSEDTSK